MSSSDLRNLDWRYLAALLGFSSDGFVEFVASQDQNFRPTVKKFVGTKKREIDRPLRPHKRQLRRLNRILRKLLPVHCAAYCGVPGRSRHQAVARHLGRGYYVVRDLKNCYPSISTARMQDKLQELGLGDETAKLLSMLFTVRGRISQGSPLSSLALNVFMYPLDEWCQATVSNFEGRYSRYGDDMILSFANRCRAEGFAILLDEAIADYGLEVNENKRRERGFQTAAGSVELLGLVVNNARGTRVPKQKQEEYARFSARYIGATTSVDPDSLPTVAGYRRSLIGMINDSRQAHFSNARFLMQQLRRGDQLVIARLARSGIHFSKTKWWMKAGKRDEPTRIATLWRATKENYRPRAAS